LDGSDLELENSDVETDFGIEVASPINTEHHSKGKQKSQETGLTNSGSLSPSEGLKKEEYIAFIQLSLDMVATLFKHGLPATTSRGITHLLENVEERKALSERLWSLIKPEVRPFLNSLHRLDMWEQAFSLEDANIRPNNTKLSTYGILLSERCKDKDGKASGAPGVPDLEGLVYIGIALGKDGLKQRFGNHSIERHRADRRNKNKYLYRAWNHFDRQGYIQLASSNNENNKPCLALLEGLFTIWAHAYCGELYDTWI